MSHDAMLTLLSNFRERLRKVREESGESQGDLSEAMDTSQTMVSRYERGDSSPSLSYILKFCAHYKVSADYLLGIPESYGKNA